MTDTEQIVSRGRPRGFDAEAGVVTATRLFRERGYEAVGVAELTHAIGIRPPSFYAAYGNKAGLLERVLAHYGAQETGFLEAALEGSRSVSDAAARLFHHAADTYTADPTARGCLVLEGMRNCSDAQVCALAGAARANFTTFLKDWLAGAGADPCAASDLAAYAMMVLSGLSAEARAGSGQVDLVSSAGIAAEGFRIAATRRGLE